MIDTIFAIIVWYDATDKVGIPISEIKDSSKYLTKRTSYGRLAHEDKNGYVLITDIDEDGECEITTIPLEWVESVQLVESEFDE